jgi:DNA-binding transcriptional MerR regulator
MASQQCEIDIPDKKYYTIGEVSEICQLKSHVLRYWEQVFPQLSPSKRRGRRYYQKQDLVLLIEIRSLLHEQGFTISGAKARLSESNNISDVPLNSSELEIRTVVSPLSTINQPHQVQVIKEELMAFKHFLQQTY